MESEYCGNGLTGMELISEANKPSETSADNAETMEIISALHSPLLQILKHNAETSQQIPGKISPRPVSFPLHTGRKGWYCFQKQATTESGK